VKEAAGADSHKETVSTPGEEEGDLKKKLVLLEERKERP